MKDRIVYRHYPLIEPLIVNGYEFSEVIISDHRKEKHAQDGLTDKDILEITKQLHLETFDIHRGKRKDGYEWQSFYWEPFFYKEKPYRLVWYWEIGKTWLLVNNCHRVSSKRYKNYENH